jgi:dienelactone hydrolase
MHSLEDTQAAVAFLRDAANAGRLRVDPERIALMGFSYGGPVVLQAAAQDPRIHAVALLDGTDMRADLRELSGTPEPAIAWMDSLVAVRLASSGRALVDEIVSQQAFWDPARAAPGLAGKHVLLVVASGGTGAEAPISPSLQEIFGARSRLTSLTMDTDHGFSDHRIALTRAVLAWAQALR